MFEDDFVIAHETKCFMCVPYVFHVSPIKGTKKTFTEFSFSAARAVTLLNRVWNAFCAHLSNEKVLHVLMKDMMFSIFTELNLEV